MAERKNYKLTISYDGTNFKGWQKQKGSGEDTIQGKLEHIASLLNGCETVVNGAGRTDAGVHATGQVAGVFIREGLTPEEIKDYFNRYLPETVSVDACEAADPDFHPRLCAKAKTYEYNVSEGLKPPVFERKYLYCYGKKLDVEKMAAAAGALTGTHDFKGFSTAAPKKKSTVRTLTEASVFRAEGIGLSEERNGIPGLVKIRLTGDGFLYNEVRIIAGTLLEIGSGDLPEDIIGKVLETGRRDLAGFTAPAEGLFLTKVYYGD